MVGLIFNNVGSTGLMFQVDDPCHARRCAVDAHNIHNMHTLEHQYTQAWLTSRMLSCMAWGTCASSCPSTATCAARRAGPCEEWLFNGGS